MKELEVKLYHDRENRLLTGKTYSCYAEGEPGDHRDVTISGQKMFYNFSSSPEEISPNKASETFRPQNVKLNSERDEDQTVSSRPMFHPQNIELISGRDGDEEKKKPEKIESRF